MEGNIMKLVFQVTLSVALLMGRTSMAQPSRIELPALLHGEVAPSRIAKTASKKPTSKSSSSADLHSSNKRTTGSSRTNATNTTSENAGVVDQMPEFPGDVTRFLSENLRYPKDAVEVGIEGRVWIQFIVDT